MDCVEEMYFFYLNTDIIINVVIPLNPLSLSLKVAIVEAYEISYVIWLCGKGSIIFLMAGTRTFLNIITSVCVCVFYSQFRWLYVPVLIICVLMVCKVLADNRVSYRNLFIGNVMEKVT